MKIPKFTMSQKFRAVNVRNNLQFTDFYDSTVKFIFN